MQGVGWIDERPGPSGTRHDALVVATCFYYLGWFLPSVSTKLTQSPSFTKPSCS
jgi:hypothetical protein